MVLEELGNDLIFVDVTVSDSDELFEVPGTIVEVGESATTRAARMSLSWVAAPPASLRRSPRGFTRQP